MQRKKGQIFQREISSNIKWKVGVDGAGQGVDDDQYYIHAAIRAVSSGRSRGCDTLNSAFPHKGCADVTETVLLNCTYKPQDFQPRCEMYKVFFFSYFTLFEPFYFHMNTLLKPCSPAGNSNSILFKNEYLC